MTDDELTGIRNSLVKAEADSQRGVPFCDAPHRHGVVEGEEIRLDSSVTSKTISATCLKIDFRDKKNDDVAGLIAFLAEHGLTTKLENVPFINRRIN